MVAHSTVAARLPKEDEKALRFVMAYEGVDKSSAVRKMVELGLSQWRKEEALRLLVEGKRTFSSSAAFAGVSLWEWLDFVKEKKLPYIHVSEADVKQGLDALQ